MSIKKAYEKLKADFDLWEAVEKNSPVRMEAVLKKNGLPHTPAHVESMLDYANEVYYYGE